MSEIFQARINSDNPLAEITPGRTSTSGRWGSFIIHGLHLVQPKGSKQARSGLWTLNGFHLFTWDWFREIGRLELVSELAKPKDGRVFLELRSVIGRDFGWLVLLFLTHQRHQILLIQFKKIFDPGHLCGEWLWSVALIHCFVQFLVSLDQGWRHQKWIILICQTAFRKWSSNIQDILSLLLDQFYILMGRFFCQGKLL